MNTLDLFKLPLYWEMVNAEKITLLNLLNEIKPAISIEIGTKQGGSLQLISALSKTVYSLDIDPGVAELRNRFPNVNFITGDSKETLPALIKDLKSKGEQPDFILVDGEHTSTGVRSDIENILKIGITKPLVVLMHDSFNPTCRRGMLEAEYKKNPCVEWVDIDFIQGIFSPNETTKGEMWGGFGMIYLKPGAENEGPLIKQSNAYSYDRMYNLSNHLHLKATTFTSRIRSYFFRKIFTDR